MGGNGKQSDGGSRTRWRANRYSSQFEHLAINKNYFLLVARLTDRAMLVARNLAGKTIQAFSVNVSQEHLPALYSLISCAHFLPLYARLQGQITHKCLFHYPIFLLFYLPPRQLEFEARGAYLTHRMRFTNAHLQRCCGAHSKTLVD